MSFNLSKDTIETIARTAALALALTNQLLNGFGIEMLPIEDSDLNTLVSTGLTITASLVNWWCNQNFTGAAKTGQTVTNAIKLGIIKPEEIETIINSNK